MQALNILLKEKVEAKLEFNKTLLSNYKEIIINHSSLISRTINDVLSKQGKVIICGNGGSQSQASHLAAELIVRFKAESTRPPLAAIALGSDASVITACGNDFGYENIFSRQMQALLNPNDCFITFSTSGKSKNIINAINYASNVIPNKNIILITGNNDLNYGDVNYIRCPAKGETDNYQEYHLLLIHMICHSIEYLYK